MHKKVKQKLQRNQTLNAKFKKSNKKKNPPQEWRKMEKVMTGNFKEKLEKNEV